MVAYIKKRRTMGLHVPREGYFTQAQADEGFL